MLRCFRRFDAAADAATLLSLILLLMPLSYFHAADA